MAAAMAALLPTHAPAPPSLLLACCRRPPSFSRVGEEAAHACVAVRAPPLRAHVRRESRPHEGLGAASHLLPLLATTETSASTTRPAATPAAARAQWIFSLMPSRECTPCRASGHRRGWPAGQADGIDKEPFYSSNNCWINKADWKSKHHIFSVKDVSHQGYKWKILVRVARIWNQRSGDTATLTRAGFYCRHLRDPLALA